MTSIISAAFSSAHDLGLSVWDDDGQHVSHVTCICATLVRAHMAYLALSLTIYILCALISYGGDDMVGRLSGFNLVLLQHFCGKSSLTDLVMPVPSSQSNSTITARLLDVVEQDIVPLTEQSVAAGNKFFGAAILKKSDLSLVIAETNYDLESPLWHGEVYTLKRFYELNSGLSTKDLIFLSTHEPCTMCMSAITWAGFDNFYSFFSHEDSRDSFEIPYDLRILKELFGLEPGGYRRHNAYWNSYLIADLVAAEDEPQREALEAQVARINKAYRNLFDAYQHRKSGNVAA